MKIQYLSVFILLSSLINFTDPALAKQEELKGKHFVILYHPEVGKSTAQKVLRTAEKFYSSIAQQIGFTRYNNFWTWEERVKIVVYPDQQSFAQDTGQPEWSRGYASRDSAIFKSRAILTYKQESEFYDGVLPHEIGHLVLIDFLGEAAIQTPIWFHEGVAQLQEGQKKVVAKDMMQYMTKKNAYVPLHQFVKLDFRTEKDPFRVQLLYGQSVSVVDFMISKYGSSAFGRLCKNIRDGLNFDTALRKAYPGTIDTLEKLENKWIRSLSH